MADLADLFVSYVPPERRSKSTVTTEEPSVMDELEAARSIKSRIAQILDPELEDDTDTKTADEPTNYYDVYDDSDTPEVVADSAASHDTFNWYMRQIQQPVATEDTNVGDTPNTPEVFTVPQYNFTGQVAKYSRGKLDQEIRDLFASEGIHIKVTSGQRKANAAGNAGDKSYHIHGNACDIVPDTSKGETFASLRKKITNSPKVMQFLYENGLGVLDETLKTHKQRTKATGNHFHIGPDQWALYVLDSWTGVRSPLLKKDYKPPVEYPIELLGKNWDGLAYEDGSGRKFDESKKNTPKFKDKQEWTRTVYTAFYNGLKNEFGNKYTDDRYKKIATYMTYQAANESGYGEHANGYNFGGHKKKGKVLHYATLDDFVKAHIQTLKKWDFMEAKSLKEYVDSLYKGSQKYNAHSSPTEYYTAINGTSARINGYLGLVARYGGKFADLRELYAKNTSKYWR